MIKPGTKYSQKEDSYKTRSYNKMGSPISFAQDVVLEENETQATFKMGRLSSQKNSSGSDKMIYGTISTGRNIHNFIIDDNEDCYVSDNSF